MPMPDGADLIAVQWGDNEIEMRALASEIRAYADRRATAAAEAMREAAAAVALDNSLNPYSATPTCDLINALPLPPVAEAGTKTDG